MALNCAIAGFIGARMGGSIPELFTGLYLVANICPLLHFGAVPAGLASAWPCSSNVCLTLLNILLPQSHKVLAEPEYFLMLAFNQHLFEFGSGDGQAVELLAAYRLFRQQALYPCQLQSSEETVHVAAKIFRDTGMPRTRLKAAKLQTKQRVHFVCHEDGGPIHRQAGKRFMHRRYRSVGEASAQSALLLPISWIIRTGQAAPGNGIHDG